MFFRPARRDDLCPVHQGHGHVRASDDVFHHSALGLLHRLGVWRRHHADAVLPAHPVGFSCVSNVPGGTLLPLLELAKTLVAEFLTAASSHVFFLLTEWEWTPIKITL